LTTADQIHNLNLLGYTDREAAFLCFAALHSGYFVRRQFLEFTAGSRGKLDMKLIEKLLDSRHAAILKFPHNRTIYSFCSKPFFQAIGEGDNRNRRTHESTTIRRRLLGLDFMLSHRDRSFQATERDKLTYFHDVRKVPKEYLPARQYRSKESPETTSDRYFVEKFPIAVSQDSPSAEARVEFCFVDPLHHGESGFEQFLQDYLPLLGRVGHAQVIYVGPYPHRFPLAHEVFNRVIVRQDEQKKADSKSARLLSFFRDRDAYERGDLTSFNQQKLIQFREDRKAFSGDDHDALFARWKAYGEAVIRMTLFPTSEASGMLNCEFQAFQSPYNYELFGTPKCVVG
jgi:hypothetical protein